MTRKREKRKQINILFTPTELEQLDRRAGSLPRSTFLRLVALGLPLPHQPRITPDRQPLHSSARELLLPTLEAKGILRELKLADQDLQNTDLIESIESILSQCCLVALNSKAGFLGSDPARL